VTEGAVAALDLRVGTPVTALIKATAFDSAD
jgi:molybdopterin-binding protein